MRFIPSYKLEILNEENFSAEILNIEKLLDLYKQCGEFFAFDNTKIYYEFFLADKPKANIVIVHGLSEFTKKFYELTYYLLQQGYNVFVYDQRCHGLSGRLTKQQEILHVDDFNDYALDLEQFIEQIVIPTQDIPIYLYSHSMGGAVSVLYLAKHQDKIKKAVFSAPLFEPVVNSVPAPIARASVRLGRIFLGPKKRFFLSNDFDPDVKYKESYGSSRARFEHNIFLRKENEKYQSSPMSFSWVYNSLTVKNKILNEKCINGIKTPILLISAEKDATVKNEPQREFAKRCESCEFIEIKGVTHALLASESKELEQIIKLTFNFFSK